jgi:hypothetical protein
MGFFPMFGGLYPDEDDHLEDEEPTNDIADYKEDDVTDDEVIDEDLLSEVPNFNCEEIDYVDFLGVKDILNSPQDDYGEFYADEKNYKFTRETMANPFLSIFMAHGRDKARQEHGKPTQQGKVQGLQYKCGGVLMNKAITFIIECGLVVILRRGDWNKLTRHPKDRGKDSSNSGQILSNLGRMM